MNRIEYVALLLYCCSRYTFDKKIRVDDITHEFYMEWLEETDFSELTDKEKEMIKLFRNNKTIDSTEIYTAYDLLKSKYKFKEEEECEDSFTRITYCLSPNVVNEEEYPKNFTAEDLKAMLNLAFSFYNFMLDILRNTDPEYIIGPYDAANGSKVLSLRIYS